MAEKLGLGTEVQELKIGQSFFQSGPSGNGGKNPTTYHTVRYDFKPASSSTADSGYLQLDETNKGVSVTVPHVGGGQTNFSGHQKKANQKECILIIDRATGEITLERLSSQILVKKTRPEKPEKSNSNIPPPPPPSTSKPNVAPPPPEIKPAQKPCQLPATVVGNDRQMQRSQSPAAPRHQQQKKQQHPVTSSSSAAGAASDTKPTLSEDLSLGSSSDSSSSSASESSDDSDDDNDPPAPSAKPTATSSQPPPPPSSFSMPDFLSDDFGGHSASSSRGVSQAAPPASTASSSLSHAKAQPISMPQLLNHDLELSESDSE